MILTNKTLTEFNYSISDLKPSSCKMVVWQCDNCGIEKNKIYRLAKKNKLCVRCSNIINANTNIAARSIKMKEWYTMNPHPIKGVERPPHVKQALIKALTGREKSEDELSKMSMRMKGSNNPFYGKRHTAESLHKIALKRKTKKGKESNFYGRIYHGKGEWIIPKNGAKIYVRSSYERKYAFYLDAQNISWKYEPTTFDLIIDNKEQSYTPDFFIINTNEYIEIKGYWREDAKIKFEALKEQYPMIKITVLDKQHLLKLKII